MRWPENRISILVIDDHERMPKLLLASIRDGFPSHDVEAECYPDIWSALERVQLNPVIVFLRHELKDYDGLDAIPLIHERFPAAFIILTTQGQDLDFYARAYARGAGRVLRRDQWMFRKVHRILQHRLEGLLHRPGAFERFLRFQRGRLVSIIEPDPTLLFRLHFRLSQRLDGRVEGYRSVEDFYQRVQAFPDTLLLSHTAMDMADSGGLERLTAVRPDMRIIVTYRGQTDMSAIIAHRDDLTHALADVSNTRLDDLDRLVRQRV